MKTDKIWICESVGKLKGIGKQGEAKINETSIHIIDDLQRYVYQTSNLRLRMNLWTWAGNSTREKDTFHQIQLESEEYVFLKIWIEMGREVKVFLLHVKILLYNWSDPVYDEEIFNFF